MELGVLEDRALLELQSGPEHRTTGSQDEQHEQEDDEREEERVDVNLPESCGLLGLHVLKVNSLGLW